MSIKEADSLAPYALMAWRWCFQGTEHWPLWPEGPQMVRAHKAWNVCRRSACWRKYGEKGYFPVSLHEPDINPNSHYLHSFSLCTETIWDGFQKAFLLCASWRLLFWQVKNTQQLAPSLYRQHFVEFATPPGKNPRRNLVRCATSLTMLIDMVMRILSVDFSFYTSPALRSSRVASHVNTCVPLRHPDSRAYWC